MLGTLGECRSQSSAPRSVIPAKRSDDEVQFISSKPVKRRKPSDQAPKPTVQQQNISTTPNTPVPPVSSQSLEFKDSDRRISTGMVGLPSDFNTMELTSMLRGVSLPVLERFVLNQPPRGPRPPSSPELSPKQLPQSIIPAVSNTNAGKNGPRRVSPHIVPVEYLVTGENVARSGTNLIKPLNPASAADQPHIIGTSVAHTDSSPPASDKSSKEVDPGGLAKSTLLVPNAEASFNTTFIPVGSPSSNNAAHNTIQPDAIKRPCQICARMRHHADFVKSQGFSALPHNVPHHLFPQVACHQPFSQHVNPHMIAMGQNGIHSLSPGFAPLMMSLSGNNYATLPAHTISPSRMRDQVDEKKSVLSHTTMSSQIQPPPTQAASNFQPSAASNPTKPPASLIQPTYRKPSPNLIVDVAETCQERFPFEDVAKRHNVSVEKVFDVFAAIIQVPLLRCPTDRRRAGKLATTRVKEYTKAKKAIQEANSQNGPDSADKAVVKPLDIANRLGQVNLPGGFSPRKS
ncbi:hypothetical protein F5Y11DRAFT_222334 [Daldinia sp. FL1419]|nr:hypothetical protein F5Y11DRAFT_222334 [Daldinia sp. FL1419]